MPLRPHQFKAFREFFENLKADLASLRQTIQESSTSIRNQHVEEQQSQQSEREKTRKVIASLRPTPDEQAAAETNQDRRHRENLRMQRWLTVGTWLAFSAAAIYAWIADEQFNELENSTETAHQQLTETQNTLDKDMSQFDRTMSQMINQTSAQIKSAKAAESAANTARDALEIQTRPWVKIEGTPKIADPDETGPAIPTRINERLINFGPLPAANVTSAFGLVDGMSRSVDYFGRYDPCKEADSLLHQILSDPANYYYEGATVFPGPDGVIPQDRGINWPLGHTVAKAVLMGCIAYNGPVGTKTYHTRLMYRVTEGPGKLLRNRTVARTISDLTLFWSDSQ